MSDEPTKEQKFSCGCHVVNGVLAAECTQVAPSGEISAERHGVLKPFSQKCSRKAAIHDATRAKAEDDLRVAEVEVAAVDGAAATSA